MAKRPVPKFDFKPAGQDIKEARKAHGDSRKKASDEMFLYQRCLVDVENKGQHLSLQVFYELVTRYEVSVDQLFFQKKSAEKGTQRRQLDALLDGMNEQGGANTDCSG